MTTIEERKLFNKLLELMIDVNDNWEVGISAIIIDRNKFFFRSKEKSIVVIIDNKQLKENEVEVGFSNSTKSIIININKLNKLLLFYLVLLD